MTRARARLDALLRTTAMVAVGWGGTAAAQNAPVYSTGVLTPGHALVVVQTGTPGGNIVKDGGPALAGNFTEIGVTNDGLPVCIRDKSQTHIFCVGANSLGGGLISYQPIGSGVPLPLQFNLNGTLYPFPFTSGGILGPVSTTVDNLAAWNNTSGTLLKDPGIPKTGVARAATYLYPPANCPAGNNANPAVPWIAITPDGSAVPGINATLTNGFNETEAYDFLNGWSTIVVGRGGEITGGVVPSPNFACYMQTTNVAGFIVKPLANRFVDLRGVFMACNGNANKGCFNIDSMVEGEIWSLGSQIVSAPTTCLVGSTDATGVGTDGTVAILVKPTNPVPVENIIGVGNSRMKLPQTGTACVAGEGDAILALDAVDGVIGALKIETNELNGQGSAGGAIHVNFALVARNAGTNPIQNNTIEISGEAHFTNQNAIRLGGTASTLVSFNTIRAGSASVNNAAADVIDNYGLSNKFEIGTITSNEGPFNYGIVTEAGAVGNEYHVGFIAGGTQPVPVNDLANWHNDYFIGTTNVGWINRYSGGRVENFLAVGAPQSCGSGPTVVPGSTNAHGAINVGGTVDVSGTGSITGTALTFTGGTLNDIVTGTGVTPGTQIVGGASPNWTVNFGQTVPPGTTLTLIHGTTSTCGFNFGITFATPFPNCTASVNQPGTVLSGTTPQNGSQTTFSASSPMPAGSVMSYNCG
jgi:hypothetical protein